MSAVCIAADDEYYVQGRCSLVVTSRIGMQQVVVRELFYAHGFGAWVLLENVSSIQGCNREES